MYDKNTVNNQIIKMPKLELHLHLEGAFSFEFLFTLINKYGGNSEIKSIDELRNKFIFKDFNHFIEMWYWKNQFFREYIDFEELAFNTLKNLAKQNVIYAELFFSPWDFSSAGFEIGLIAESIIKGVKRGEKQFPIRCNLIADLVRNYGANSSLKRLDEITPFLNSGVVGIGLGGSEKEYPPNLFKEVFIEAKKRGFRTTVHAGESAGADSIWSAILDCKAERIGHGVRVVEDPMLIDYLIKRKISLEVCITSNLKTRVFDSIEKHPFKYLDEMGVMVTVNSDDPPMFGSNITEELILLNKEFGYEIKDLVRLMKNSVKAAFLEASDKNIYISKLDKFLISASEV
ncbi:MAG: adenosine deaminase [Melioribacteraceae bacterium]|nr:adenosine deaminase [Melioribacteraceae bacterium]